MRGGRFRAARGGELRGVNGKAQGERAARQEDRRMVCLAPTRTDAFPIRKRIEKAESELTERWGSQHHQGQSSKPKGPAGTGDPSMSSRGSTLWHCNPWIDRKLQSSASWTCLLHYTQWHTLF
nr:uncharacterized protein LOC112544555 isoform X2 [Pelodiscus sinensis]|eukprot:XP_025036746.1 uncharacterized protein LOC112544555 isoform X2 [Pelodiscus sinensis]